MELRISRVKPSGGKLPDESCGVSIESPDGQNKILRKEAEDIPRQTAALDNGVSLIKQGERYFMSIEGEEIEISEDELCRVYEQPDSAFELVIEKKRKFWFSASIDNVGMLRH